MMRYRRRRTTTSGFTLLELLIVILIISVLFAIAAPGWDAILTRQRVSTAREQVLQALRQAQSNARTSRVPQVVIFDNNVVADGSQPRYIVSRYIATTTPYNWQYFGNGNLKPGNIQVTTNATNRIVFDSNGAVAQAPVISTEQTLPFTVTVKGPVNAPGPDRCVKVETLLGATRLAEGDDCKPAATATP